MKDIRLMKGSNETELRKQLEEWTGLKVLEITDMGSVSVGSPNGYNHVLTESERARFLEWAGERKDG